MVLQLLTDVIVWTTNECVTVSLSSSHGLGYSLQGAHFGSDKRTLRKMWQKTPYGLSLPYVLNSMSRDAYEFLQRNLHFTDHYKQQPEGGVTIWQSRGVSEGNVHAITLLLHKRKQITSLITMPLTEMIGIVQTTRRQSARIDSTWEFSAGRWTG